MKRRNILKIAGSSLALAAAGLNTRTARAQGDGAAAGAFAWSRASAQGLAGQAFWLNHPQAGAMSITLAEVSVPHTTVAAAGGAPHIDQFSLVFHGPLQAQIDAATYEIDHPALGRFDLYLSPAGRAGGNAVYRSDFSLLL